MRVILTGAAGYLGSILARRLSCDVDLVATDRTLPPGMQGIEGDLNDPTTLAQLFEGGCDAVIHLATIPGGAAEDDADRAWLVNVEGTRQLAQAAAATGARPRFVFASSIAALGTLNPNTPVDDRTLSAPSMLYGGHKAMLEIWLAMLGRRGDIDPVTLRLPGIVARADHRAGLKSAFMSDVFHAVSHGRSITLPVSSDATIWLMSGQRAANNLSHALTAKPTDAPINLPALRVRVSDLVDAIARHARVVPDVRYAPDPLIENAFGKLPALSTPAAEALGYASDGSLEALVRRALGDQQ